MGNEKSRRSYAWLPAVAAIAVCASSLTATAGGFAVREQSTVFLGSAFAGAAAGGSLSSMYWNSAAAASLPGFNSESAYTLILPDADVTVTSIGGAPFPPNPGSNSGDIGIDAVASASYYSYQLSSDLWLGLGLNAPFGLSTKPENDLYFGNLLANTTKLFTINANPTIAYRIAPGITVGVGVQVEWARGKLAFGFPGAISRFKGDDWAFGATAGVLVQTGRDSSIGLGWRSQLTHDLDGSFITPRIGIPASAEVNLPDIVTLSIRQAVAPNMRLLGTVEWTNWSRFENLTLVPALGGPLTIPANWADGWFFSVGGEYDYSPGLTLRAGVAYEISPVDDPTKRLTSIPDNDRFWLNVGASYKYSEWTSIDFAYSHVFVQDADFARTPVGVPVVFAGNVDASVDLISIGIRSKLDWLSH